MENAKQFRERVYEYAANVKKKKEIVKEELESDHMKECTFRPQVIQPTEQPRNLQDFIGEQTKFQQRVKDNVERIALENKAKEDINIAVLPQIDEYSKTLIQEKRGEGPIYERLYAISKKKPVEKEEKKVIVFIFLCFYRNCQILLKI